MTAAPEFNYRLRRRAPGQRPGSHPGSAIGAGLEFVGHHRLLDHPDPRRLDLRASLTDLRGDWLVRVHRQRAAIAVRMLVDVSSSMQFGEPSKRDLVAEFARMLGRSAFRVGDSLGMEAFDADVRDDLHVPDWRGRGAGEEIARRLRQAPARAGGIEGLRRAARRLAGRRGLVFLASDFHWPLADLGSVLDALAPADVVPLVVWDPAETAPPEGDGIAMLADAETGRRRTLWLRPALRTRWAAAVAARRQELETLFHARGLRPFYLQGTIDAEALSRYFLEQAA